MAEPSPRNLKVGTRRAAVYELGVAWRACEVAERRHEATGARQA